MPVAYSYKRFSSSSQATGDSLRRQTEMAESYCDRNQLTLSHETFEDLGVSGFSGANLEEGSALNAFLSAVQSGRIPKGSFLLIETFDRLTRLNPDRALPLLMSLMAAGITVVTLHDEQSYSSDGIGSNLGSLMLSVVQLFVGHEESKRKSIRLSAVYRQKRETKDNRIRLPFWIGRNAGGDLVLKENEADTVRHIFQLAANEGLGSRAIASRLNKEGRKSPTGGRWGGSSVANVLRAKSTYGEYEPHTAAMFTKRQPAGIPISGFYPAVIDKSTFVKANRAKRAVGPKPSASGPRNLFSGMLRCSCGQPLHFKRSSKRDKLDRLFCPARCGAKSIPYEEFEAVTILGFMEVLYERIDSEHRPEPVLDAYEAKMEEVDKRIGNVLAAIQVGGEIAELVSTLNSLKLEKAALQEQMDSASETAQEDTEGQAAWRALAGQEYVFEKDVPEYRRKLESAFRRWVVEGHCLKGADAGNVMWIISPRRKHLLGDLESRTLPTRLPRHVAYE